MGTIGYLKEFSLHRDFEIWFQQFEEYVMVNSIPRARLVSLFLTFLAVEGYKVLRNLCVPNRPKERDKTSKDIVNLIKIRLNPKPPVD